MIAREIADTDLEPEPDEYFPPAKCEASRLNLTGPADGAAIRAGLMLLSHYVAAGKPLPREVFNEYNHAAAPLTLGEFDALIRKLETVYFFPI